MANYDPVRLDPGPLPDTWPPGSVDYPAKLNSFIDLAEATDTEVENARELESSLITNLTTNYATFSLSSNINGLDTYKLTNMVDSAAAQHYATKSECDIAIGVSEIDDTGFNNGFTDPDSELFVLDSTDFSVFDTDPASITYDGTYNYPASFNATYFLDWNVITGSNIRLDRPAGIIPIPVVGDRLRFIATNTASGDGIQAVQRKIMGLTSIITYGDTFDFAIYDMVYANTNIGWFFTNVITGNLPPP